LRFLGNVRLSVTFRIALLVPSDLKFQNATPPSIFDFFEIFLHIWNAYEKIKLLTDFFPEIMIREFFAFISVNF